LVIWLERKSCAQSSQAALGLSSGVIESSLNPKPSVTTADTVSTFGKPENHRMTEVGRDLLRSSSPNLLLKQGHLKAVLQDQDKSRQLLSISKDGDSTDSLSNFCWCSVTLQ